MRVLLIEDNNSPTRIGEFMLQSQRFTVHTTRFGEDSADLQKLSKYDLIVLDLNTPDVFRVEALRNLNVSRGKTPILILFRGANVEREIRALGFGPDDYMIKPVRKEELIVRMQAVVSRAKGYARPVVDTGVLAIDLETRTVTVAGNRVHVTDKEYEVLELLSLHKGVTLTKEMFLDHLYGGLNEPEAKIIDVFICKLRKKLANASNGKQFIETIWGRGYTLREPKDYDAQFATSLVPLRASIG